MEKREYYVVVERDGNGGFKGDVAQFFSCKSWGKTLDDLMANMRKTIESCLRSDNQDILSEINGVYKIRIVCESQATDGNFYVLVKDDGEGGYIGIAPELKGCLSHGLTLEELMSNMEEVISLCLEGGEEAMNPCFFGVQRVAI